MTLEINSQEQWVLSRLNTFYEKNPIALEKLRSILAGTSTISLRVVDWFVTNYAKMNDVSYTTTDGRQIIVYLAYKARLKAYTKKMLDPFCRWDRITFHGVSTTVGQLNFFAWAVEDEILEYLESHLETIQADMDTRGHAKKPQDGTQRRRRHELSHSATKSMRRHAGRVVVGFS
jgi:hypothetical protein